MQGSSEALCRWKQPHSSGESISATGHHDDPLYLRSSWATIPVLSFFSVDLRSLSFRALLSEHYYIKAIRITHTAQYVVGFPQE